ncbi:MAG TPA: STAS domain-containing protein, partial [Verrucomicrobiae bacterium]|nr:STAS domain-containing protein [Verrucomicrobiae bacterium]
IVGRANFASSIDFKTLLDELLQRDYDHFILELSECLLMDSTFLGVLAGFALKLNGANSENSQSAIELLNPNPRVSELLDTIGVLHLFQVSRGGVPIPCQVEPAIPAASQPTQEEVTRNCLEAHRTLMSISPKNASRFKEVALFLAEDLKKQKANS